MNAFLGQDTVTRTQRDELVAAIAKAQERMSAITRLYEGFVKGVSTETDFFGGDFPAFDAAWKEWDAATPRVLAVESELGQDKQTYAVSAADRALASRWVALADQMYALYIKHGGGAGGIPLWLVGGVVLVGGLLAVALLAQEKKPTIRRMVHDDAPTLPRAGAHDHA